RRPLPRRIPQHRNGKETAHTGFEERGLTAGKDLQDDGHSMTATSPSRVAPLHRDQTGGDWTNGDGANRRPPTPTPNRTGQPVPPVLFFSRSWAFKNVLRPKTRCKIFWRGPA